MQRFHGSPDLSVSVVTYFPDAELLARTLSSLRRAVLRAIADGALGSARLVLVDHGGEDPSAFACESLAGAMEWECLAYAGNPGFGAGHNRAIERCNSEFHLVLNPDVDLDEDALANALVWMRQHPEAVALAPEVADFAGQRSYLCRRMPGIRVLLLRAFAPRWLKARCARPLADYEMRDIMNAAGHEAVWDPPLISGCFMLFRTAALHELGGFDARFFLYFEDYDLSLRATKIGRLAYVPSVRIRHAGGATAKKGGQHILFFCRSAWRFFRLHGWRF